jgi:hypothetical protein
MAKKKKYPFSVNAFLSTVDGGRTIASYRQNQTTGPALGRQRPSDTRHLVGKRHRRDPERFDHLGPLAHQKIARPMQHQLALLLVGRRTASQIASGRRLDRSDAYGRSMMP